MTSGFWSRFLVHEYANRYKYKMIKPRLRRGFYIGLLCFDYWCGGGESNSHSYIATRSLVLRVYQFRHPRGFSHVSHTSENLLSEKSLPYFPERVNLSRCIMSLVCGNTRLQKSMQPGPDGMGYDFPVITQTSRPHLVERRASFFLCGLPQEKQATFLPRR